MRLTAGFEVAVSHVALANKTPQQLPAIHNVALVRTTATALRFINQNNEHLDRA
jgi:hypothetical protein